MAGGRRSCTVAVSEQSPIASCWWKTTCRCARGMAENPARRRLTSSILAHDGQAGFDRARAGDYDVLVLDVMLPRMSGLELCVSLRHEGVNTPVLFLTARGDPQDRVLGLEAGGDDYLTKPFNLDEFLLRVRAILRRWAWYRASVATARPHR